MNSPPKYKSDRLVSSTITQTELPFLSVTQQEGWRLLKTHLALSKGFTFIIVTTPDAGTAHEVAANLRSLIPDESTWKKFDLDPDQPADSLAQDFLRLDKGGTPQVLMWVDTAALALASLERMRGYWEQAFTSLNRRRNQLASDLRGTLALVGTPEMVDALREFAPDLWSIRSAYINFSSAPKEEASLGGARAATPAGRRQQALQAILSAFRGYEELGLDNYAHAEQAAPDIWDLFVQPPCADEYLRPEDIDSAQQETPARFPAQDLLPRLAQPNYRRTVLLADPGMGKSTLVQSLIAMLASGRHISGAPELTGMFPVPIILRDLVPLLPQDSPENWSWNLLLTVLLTNYKREDKAAPLFNAFHGQRQEFFDLLQCDTGIFFFIDGLDEIGNLAKRQQIVRVIQDGIRLSHKEARWLITSRVIGYEEAPAEYIDIEAKMDLVKIAGESASPTDAADLVRVHFEALFADWKPYSLSGIIVGHLSERVRHIMAGNTEAFVPSELMEAIGGKNPRAQVQIAQRLYLTSFDDHRQEQFAQRWFHLRKVPDYSEELFRELRRPAAHGVRVISRVPNLLCFMVILKRSGKPLPDGRAALYHEISKAYLSGIDSSYRLSSIHGHDCPFDPVSRTEILAHIAAHMQSVRSSPPDDTGDEKTTNQEQEDDTAKGSILISMPVLEWLLHPVIERMQTLGRVTREQPANILLSDLLNHIARRSGLLIPRGDDAEGRPLFGFTHLSFLEYFAAVWLHAEFQRQRNRFARLAEASSEGVTLSDEDLDRELPSPGPAICPKPQFAIFAANPIWHEVLIFLAEMNASSPAMLLRWLFPVLFPSNRDRRTENTEPTMPIMPLDAVSLAIKLASDREISVPESTRSQWWRILWSAYLEWPYSQLNIRRSQKWPVAPLLLGSAALRGEILQALATIQPQYPLRPLCLIRCQLTTSDLALLSGLELLENLDLSNCKGLERLPDLSRMRGLRSLNLSYCTGLKEAEAIHGLTGLENLDSLDLFSCKGLERLPDLHRMRRLRSLNLSYCTGLKTAEALHGLTQLENLDSLSLYGCIGLESLPDLSGLHELRTLNLNYCTGLKGTETLSSLIGLENLRRLGLQGCEGIESLPDLSSMQNLRSLDLRLCPAGKHIDDLRKQLHPECNLQVV